MKKKNVMLIFNKIIFIKENNHKIFSMCQCHIFSTFATKAAENLTITNFISCLVVCSIVKHTTSSIFLIITQCKKFIKAQSFHIDVYAKITNNKLSAFCFINSTCHITDSFT